MASVAGRMVVELCFWIAGLGLIAAYFLVTADLEAQRKQGVDLFTTARAAVVLTDRPEQPLRTEQTPGFQSKPVAVASMEPPANVDDDSLPVAVLRIASLGIEVPVYPELTERNLSRGAGWISGTAAPNQGGNMAIAAHRDQYFRPLKDIQVGDTMELESLSGRGSFRVSRIAIVDPDDVSVLEETEAATLTLVTCYPFYFSGSAPQRYIVQAVAVDQSGNKQQSTADPIALLSGETP